MFSESDLSEYESENENVNVGVNVEEEIEEEEEVDDEEEEVDDEEEEVDDDEEEEEEEVEDEEEVKKEDIPVVREIETDFQGWKYFAKSNSYIFRGFNALVDIINHHDGHVEVFLLHNSPIKAEVFLAARLNRIKNLALYTPIQMFPVCSNN
uniref:Uncharacterized protein n=1 Tax=Marseillevirus LCMAC101 TaxID=2506602 RepID=A0A481YS67_9VIRU|nr:MAG: hypothetical protein LCMAC101_03820 [Marseillevirus LCMAC101]